MQPSIWVGHLRIDVPYSHLTSLIANRTREARELRKSAELSEVSRDVSRTLRGLVYIVLFGLYEHVVRGCVASALGIANSHSVPVEELRLTLLPFALHQELLSFRDSGANKFWAAGTHLFQQASASDAALLARVFPSDGSFMKPPQLELIWHLFGLAGEPWPDRRLIGRIHELVDVRNRIAHGETPPSVEGGRVSTAEIEKRIDDVEELCSHVVQRFSVQLLARAAYVR